MHQNSLKSTGFVLLIIATLLGWGFSWPAMKSALHDIPPIWLAVVRMGIGSATLFTILILSGKNFWLTRKDMPLFLSVGLLQMGLFALLVNLGLQHVEAGRSAILVYTTPLWVTPIALFVFKEPLHKLTLLGLVIGLLGVCCLFNPLTFNWHDKTALHGNALLLLAAFVWACVILHVRFGTHHRSALELVPWQMLLATAFLVLMGCLLEPTPHIAWSWSLITKISYIGFVATAFSFWGAIEISRRLPAITTSLIFLGVPVIGLISSAIILGEKITTATIIAVALILSGLVCVVFARRVASVPVE